MSVALVQAQATAAGGSVTSQSVGINSTGAGNLLIAILTLSGGVQTISGGTNWQTIAAGADSNNNLATIVLAYYNNPGGITSVDLTWTTSSYPIIQVLEFSGVSATSLSIGPTYSSGITSTSNLTGSLGTPSSQSLVLFCGSGAPLQTLTDPS